MHLGHAMLVRNHFLAKRICSALWLGCGVGLSESVTGTTASHRLGYNKRAIHARYFVDITKILDYRSKNIFAYLKFRVKLRDNFLHWNKFDYPISE